MILSSYQGNTDSAVAFFLLLAVQFLDGEQMTSAAIVMGISFWIKLPGILALPALVFYLRNWRQRFLFRWCVVAPQTPALS